MVQVEFIGLTESKALNKALSYWCRTLQNILTIKEFISMCKIRKEGIEHIVTYNDLNSYNKKQKG